MRMQNELNVWLNRGMVMKLSLELSVDKAATSVSGSGFENRTTHKSRHLISHISLSAAVRRD